MKKIDELQKLLDQLQYEASLPEANFEMKLKTKILKRNQPDNFFDKIKNLFSTYELNYSMVFNFFAVILVVGLGFKLAEDHNFNDMIPQNSTKTAEFASPENQSIIDNVIQNNPLILLQDTPQSIGLMMEQKINSQELAANSTVKNITDNNLVYSIVIHTVPGNKSIACFESTQLEKTVSISNYKTVDNSNFFFKSIETDNNNNITNYFLTDNAHQIYYTGGVFATEQLISTSVDKLESNTPTVTAQMSNGFTQNSTFTNNIIKIENKISTDNSDLIFITQNENPGMCNNNINGNPVVSVIVIDSQENFKILSKSYYFSFPTAENLIYTNYFNTSTQNLNEAEAIKQFQFDLQKPIKLVTPTP